jgi:transcriptional regulator GlxA family with amidase domain
MQDEEVTSWVASVHERTQWTTSVCTGSLVLAAAGLLDGLRATSHWTALDVLRDYGADPTLERVVVQGKIVTAAGISSGIDMALWLAAQLAGDDVAQSIQLAIEYDPQPPFDAGSPRKVDRAVVERQFRASRFCDRALVLD